MDHAKLLQCLVGQTQIVWRACIYSVISTKDDIRFACTSYIAPLCWKYKNKENVRFILEVYNKIYCKCKIPLGFFLLLD